MSKDPHWDNMVKIMLENLGGDPSHQHRVLCGDKASIRAALKDKGRGVFDRMGDPEFLTVVSTARVALENQLPRVPPDFYAKQPDGAS